MPATFPPEEVRLNIRRELDHLHTLWAELRALLGTDESVKVVNAIASGFFSSVYRCFLAELLLGIARLTDPPESRGGKDQNIVILRLLEDPALQGNPIQLAKIRDACDAAISIAASLREHRHKALAHNDAPTMLARTDTLPVYAEDITASLHALAKAYQATATALGEKPRTFGMLLNTNGAERLLNALIESDAWRLHVRIENEKAESARDARERFAQFDASQFGDE